MTCQRSYMEALQRLQGPERVFILPSLWSYKIFGAKGCFPSQKAIHSKAHQVQLEMTCLWIDMGLDRPPMSTELASACHQNHVSCEICRKKIEHAQIPPLIN